MERERYDPQAIEPKWQKVWAESGIYRVDLVRAQHPFYNLMEFPYPSAEALHVGHVYTYCGADTYGRYRRLRGDDVFQPMGYDAFGIHSENHALKVGRHPMELTVENTQRYRRQMDELGTLFDWSHCVDTSRPDYYRWTQWLFVQLFKAGLAYRAKAPVNWCPSCLTVLANEQVIAGACERCETTVEQREMEQWFLRITAYADRLLEGHAKADLPATTVTLQRNWIGRSEGAEIDFQVVDGPKITVFTTRPDTLFGATYLVLAPEHPAVPALTADTYMAQVLGYVDQARHKRELERVAADQGKTGVPTGAYAVNPANGERIPVWIADYVLPGYGTGAIMAVPAHDERDFAFAQAHGLPIRVVVTSNTDSAGLPPHPVPPPLEGGGERGGSAPGTSSPLPPREGEGQGEGGGQASPSAQPFTQAYTGEGTLVDSGPFSGRASAEAKREITAWLAGQGAGKAAVTYRLRDWLISRQRYWGPPIPIVYCETCGTVPVPEEDLPVRLPYVPNFRPQGGGTSPLAEVPSFVNTTCPHCGGPARRETDVSDTFLDSSWYYLRYPSANRQDVPFDRELTHKWLPVSLYAGGIEHSTMHHLYARFVTLALHDLGYVDFEEPFRKLRLHGLIIKGGAKMSKSRGNVVNPDEYIKRVGADTLRLYLLFLGPYEEGGDFSDLGIRGITRFLGRVWRIVQMKPGRASPLTPAPSPSRGERGQEDGRSGPGRPEGNDSLSPREGEGQGEGGDLPRGEKPFFCGRPGLSARLAPMHRAIAAVQQDIEDLHFHTAIAALMTYLNWLEEARQELSAAEWQQATETLVLLLAPFAPHITEELWERLGKPYSVHQQAWPSYDPALLAERTITLIVQVDGKVRDRITAPAGAGAEQARLLALGSEKVGAAIGDREVGQVFHVPDRLVNIVTRERAPVSPQRT